MNSKERIMRTVRGESVDRPAVNFYEINGLLEDRLNSDPYNIFSDPSWYPILDMAQKTDRMVMLGATVEKDGKILSPIPEERLTCRVDEQKNLRFFHQEVRCGKRILSSTARQDQGINTSWQVEHLIKNADDLRAWVEDCPLPPLQGNARVEEILRREAELGDSGVVMIDTGDPLCLIAGWMPMDEYTIVAMTEPELFKQALDKALEYFKFIIQQVSDALPGRIWRICGPEYASYPYLPLELFQEYVTAYDKQLIDIIHKNHGFVRVHCHGRISALLDEFVKMGAMGIDPIEPQPQGDITLREARERVGKDLVLFGNLEASDLENLPENEFRRKVRTAITEGTSGTGKGFVLQPSACPYGRSITERTRRNYEIILEEINC